MTETDRPPTLLDAVLNLSRFHREHEKFYASSPRERAVTLQRHARTLHALRTERGHSRLVDHARADAGVTRLSPRSL